MSALGLRQDGAQSRRVRPHPFVRLRDDLLEVVRRRPAERRSDLCRVGDVERHVGGAGLGDRIDRDRLPGHAAAELGQLTERCRHAAAAADVEDLPGYVVEARDLARDEIAEIVDVQHVAHLLPAEEYLERQRPRAAWMRSALFSPRTRAMSSTDSSIH